MLLPCLAATTLRALLAGEAVTASAPTYRCAGLRLAFPGAPPAIDVMAMRPQMLRLAAQIGDGVSLGAWSSRAYLREAVQQVEFALKRFALRYKAGIRSRVLKRQGRPENPGGPAHRAPPLVGLR